MLWTSLVSSFFRLYFISYSHFVSSQIPGALRVSPRPPLFSSTILLRTPSIRRFHHNLHTNPQRIPNLVFPSPTRRLLSVSSLFTRSKPLQTPSPLVVAHITRLEAEANVHPHDVSKQLALFQALADTKLKSSYDLIITRWERTCEFVRPSHHPSFNALPLIKTCRINNLR